jgi:ABC-type nitrate/sulfonate/bicarbonate transport system substrate-binding protein
MFSLEYGVPTDKDAITVRMGIQLGFFLDEGIDLSVRIVYGGPPLAAAYNSGQLKFGEIGSPPAVAAISRGLDFKVVGSGLRRKAHMYLCVRSDISDWDDLKGKRLGLLSRGSCPEWFIRAMLIARGFDPDNHLTYVELLDQYPHVVDLLREGRIDAFLAVEPAPSLAESEGLVRVWGAVYDEPTLPQYQWIVHVAKPQFIKQEREAARAVLRACRRSAHYAADHIEEWIAFGARHYQIPEAAMRRAVMREVSHLHLDGQIDAHGLAEVIKLQDRLGAIERPIGVTDICLPDVAPRLDEPVA